MQGDADETRDDVVSQETSEAERETVEAPPADTEASGRVEEAPAVETAAPEINPPETEPVEAAAAPEPAPDEEVIVESAAGNSDDGGGAAGGGCSLSTGPANPLQHADCLLLLGFLSRRLWRKVKRA